MKSINQYIIEKEELNQSDEDFFITILGWITQEGGSFNVKDEEIVIEIPKDRKTEVIDHCKKYGYEVLKAGSCGRGYSEIIIKRDLAKQEKKYNK